MLGKNVRSDSYEDKALANNIRNKLGNILKPTLDKADSVVKTDSDFADLDVVVQ